jgi:hypothetical protein
VPDPSESIALLSRGQERKKYVPNETKRLRDAQKRSGTAQERGPNRTNESFQKR